jgi:hypothetical protein
MDPLPRHPRPGSSIEDLPNELVLEILACLLPIRGFLSSPESEAGRCKENGRRLKALHGLTLASRWFNVLSTPLLYQSFVQTAGDWSLLFFLRTAKESPETVHRLQYVEMRDCYLRMEMDSHLEPIWADLKVWAGVSHIRGLSTLDCIVSILFSLTIDIVELALEGFYYIYLCHAAIPKLARLQRLSMQRLHLPQHGPLISQHQDVDLTVAAPLVANHSPVSTYLGHMQAFSPFQGHRRLDAEAIGMFDMTLDNCSLSQYHIDGLLQGLSSLRQFTCRWRDITPIDLPRLRQALGRFCHSLEHLELDTLESGWQVTLDEDIPTIGDLRDFSVLKHLDVSGLVLWTDDDMAEHPPLASILPRSLETLAIQVEWDDYVEDSLMALSRDAASQLPNLRTIDCSWRPASAEITPLLTDMFAIVGIVLKLGIAADT